MKNSKTSKILKKILAVALVLAMTLTAVISAGLILDLASDKSSGSSDFGTSTDNTVDLSGNKIGENSAHTVNSSGGWEYVVKTTDRTMNLDGVKDGSYGAGIHYVGDVNNNAAAAATNPHSFDVWVIADATYVYFLYEVVDPSIVGNTGTGVHHSDCAEFQLSFLGNSLYIWGLKDGATNKSGSTTAYAPATYNNFTQTNVDNITNAGAEYFVKHIKDENSNVTGYNIELRIPISKTGNRFGFMPVLTADTSNATRYYMSGRNSSGAFSNNKNLDYITISREKALPVNPVTTPTINSMGQYEYTIKTTDVRMYTDGTMDPSYLGGIHVQSAYSNGGATNFKNQSYDMYMVASTDGNLYVFTEVVDPHIISTAATNTYWNDCLDFYYDWNNDGSLAQVKFWGGYEGTDHFKVGNCNATQSDIDNLTNNTSGYCVKKTSTGYNVEFKVPLSKVQKSFGFLGVMTAADTATSRTYLCNANATNSYNNTKTLGSANRCVGVISSEPVFAKSGVTVPTTNALGQYEYTIKTTDQIMATDGVKDYGYFGGIHLQGKYTSNDAAFAKNKASYDVWMVAGTDGLLHVLYEVVDDDITYLNPNNYHYRNDCADLYYDWGNDGTIAGNSIRISAKKEGTNHYVAGDYDDKTIEFINNTFENYCVKYTQAGYNVEFSIPLTTVGEEFGFRCFIANSNAEGTVYMSTPTAYMDANGYKTNEGEALGETNRLVGKISDEIAVSSPIGSGRNPDDASAYPGGVYNIYGVNTAYGITFDGGAGAADGVKDDIYKNGLHWRSDVYGVWWDAQYASSTTDTYFDVYQILDSDGKLHVYVDVIDPSIIVCDENTIVRDYYNDCMHVYLDYTNDRTHDKAASVVAPNAYGRTGGTSAFESCAVVETAAGWAFEFVMTKNGAAFSDGDEYGIRFIYNDTDAIDESYVNDIATGMLEVDQSNDELVATIRDYITISTALTGKIYNSNFAASDIIRASAKNVLNMDLSKDELLNTDNGIAANPNNTDAYASAYEAARSVTTLTDNANTADIDESTFNGSYNYNVYKIRTVYTDIKVNDGGVMDNAYTYGVCLESGYSDNVSKTTNDPNSSFKVWMVLGQDGRMYVYIRVYDTTDYKAADVYAEGTGHAGKTYAAAHGYWRTDCIQFDYSYGNPTTGSRNFWTFFNGAQFTQYRPDDYQVTDLTDGYAVEFAFDNNGRAFQEGDQLGFNVFMNDMTAPAAGTSTGNCTKHTVGLYTKGQETLGRYVSPNGVDKYTADGATTPTYYLGGSYRNDVVEIAKASASNYYENGFEGSENDPMLIATEADLAKFASLVAAGDTDLCAKLTSNITLTSAWAPLGTSTAPYIGTFDGNGYTISNLTFTGKDEIALFGYNAGAIKNVTVAGNDIVGVDKVAAIAVNNAGVIKNCTNGTTVTGLTNVAPIAAVNSGNIDSCTTGYKLTFSYGINTTSYVPEGTVYDYENVCSFSIRNGDEIVADTIVDVQAIILSATPIIEKNISVSYRVYINSIEFPELPEMTFTLGEGEDAYVLTAEAVSVGGEIYTYTFNGIPPRKMAYNLSAAWGTYATASEFSITGYADTYLGMTTDEIKAATGYDTDEKVSAFKQLLIDMVNYGAATQDYVGDTTGAQIEALAGGSTVTIPDSIKNSEKADGIGNSKIDAITLRLAYEVRMRIDLTLDEADLYNFKLVVGEKEYTLSNLMPKGEGKYSFYTDGFLATEYDEEVVVKLYIGDELVHTVTYSVESYINSNWDNANVGDLCKALYAYGESAKAFNAIAN